jgi:threonine dehydratase
VDVTVGGVAADSLGAQRIGAIAWSVCRQHVAACHLLPDEAIRTAQQRIWRELRLAVEPAAALGLAALWTGAVRPAPAERVAVVLCGANFDPTGLA